MNDATAEENAKLRARVANLERREQTYREMARDSAELLTRILRGEAWEGWIDPQLGELGTESERKPRARLHQAKQVSHWRYEEIQRLLAERKEYAIQTSKRIEEARAEGWQSGYAVGRTDEWTLHPLSGGE